MSNQSVMTFDEDFLLDRLVECLSICEFQVKRSFENEYLFHKSYDQARTWLKRYESLLGSDSPKVAHIKTRLDSYVVSLLNVIGVLELEAEEQEAVQVHNAKNQQVSKPAASVQLPVLRVLGQVSKAAIKRPERPLSLGWFPAPTKFLSNTRPVGGL